MTQKTLKVNLSQQSEFTVRTRPAEGDADAAALRGSDTLLVEPLASPWLRDFLSEHDLGSADTLEFEVAGRMVDEQKGRVEVEGRFRLTPELECVRCLTRFRKTLRTTSHAFYEKERPGAKAERVEERQLSEDELEVYTYVGPALEVDEFVLDSVNGVLPDRPLCAEDCPGLL